MADNEQQAGMPEPQPVFVVNSHHIYSGTVFKQFYVFLWMSLAFAVGCAFPWGGEATEGGYTVTQLILLVCSIGCVWSSIASIKSNRLTFWPVLGLEILAVMLIFLNFDLVKNAELERADVEIKQVQQQMSAQPNNADLKARETELREVHYGWGLGDLFTCGFASYLTDYGTTERAISERCFNNFGVGFHLCLWTCAGLLIFVIGSIVFAIVTAKPKEDPAEARRKARAESRLGSKPSDKSDDDTKDGDDANKDGGDS